MAANSNQVKRRKVGAVKAAASGCSRLSASAGILFMGTTLAGDPGVLTHHPGYQPGGPLICLRAPHDDALKSAEVELRGSDKILVSLIFSAVSGDFVRASYCDNSLR